jgi:hypothetical protein
MLNAKTVSNGGGKTVAPIEIGTYPVRLAQIIDWAIIEQTKVIWI